MSRKLTVATIVAMANLAAAFSPVQAASDHGAYSAVKTNFIGKTYSYSIDKRFKRKKIDYTSSEKRKTIIIETKDRFLYLMLANDKTLRYGIDIGRMNFTW